MGVFTRYYEFISQIIALNDKSLEKLSLFARNLQGLLKAMGIFESVDLSGLEMQAYRLAQIQKNQIKLEDKDGELDPTSVHSGEAKEKERVKLSELIDKLNEAFSGEFTESENMEHAYQVISRVKENENVINQIKNYTDDSAMQSDLPRIVDDAFMEIENVNEKKKEMYLSNEEVRKKYIKIIYALVKDLIDNNKLDYFSMENLLKGISIR